MKDLSKEILAYSLQNAIEHGEADEKRILPKLFRHGLKKEEIKKIIPVIQKTVNDVNSLSEKERKKLFRSFSQHVKEKTEERKDLDELPGALKGKKLVFRAAPFPSGALHIGNAKTYLLNALYAEKYNAGLLLVMDDTIGSAEKQPIKESYDLIQEAFGFLEVEFTKLIYKSDRLKIYYEYAEKLINKDKAYVCHCSQDVLRKNREKGLECGCRQFPKDIQLLRWKEMFKAKEGHAVLRIKTSMQHQNPAFRDRVLFKISDRKHPRVGNKYRVWPSLEMSWAIDDHLLGITHILRGNDLAMESEMEKYIWDIFKWKHPILIHTGLIKIEGAGKISKSKAQKEVLSGEFIGWDDPRTWSIQSMIKRGITKEAIKEFIKEIGLNKQDIVVPIENLYAINRRIIDMDANRYSFVPNPVRLNIEKMPEVNEVQIPVHPDKKEMKKIKVKKEIFISKKDFEKYKEKEVRLLHLFNIVADKNVKITSIENKKIPRINWVSENVPVKVLMPNGEYIEGIAESNIQSLKVGEVVQFERFGFCKYHGKSKEIYGFWFGHG